MREHLFSVTQAEREAKTESNGVLNHDGLEAALSVRNSHPWDPPEASNGGPHERLVGAGLAAPSRVLRKRSADGLKPGQP